MTVLRSLAFYTVFYTGSVYYVLASVLAVAFAPQHLRRFPDAWSRFHRSCMRVPLGATEREPGARPPGAVRYAIKHASFFEAIDLPNLLDHPVPFGKEELYRIPGGGRAAKAYGSVTVYRQ